MRRNEKDIAERIDSMSIEKARIEIASGIFGDIGSPNHRFAESWLSAREKNLNDKTNKTSFTLKSSGIWAEIEQEYGLSKRAFGKKINFIKDTFKRKIIFRDVEQAYILEAKVILMIVMYNLFHQNLNHGIAHKGRNNPSSYCFAFQMQ